MGVDAQPENTLEHKSLTSYSSIKDSHFSPISRRSRQLQREALQGVAPNFTAPQRTSTLHQGLAAGTSGCCLQHPGHVERCGSGQEPLKTASQLWARKKLDTYQGGCQLKSQQVPCTGTQSSPCSLHHVAFPKHRDIFFFSASYFWQKTFAFR